MKIIIDQAGKLYRPFNYEREDVFEISVQLLADQIFGTSTIYIPVKKRMKGNEIITIPDGYVVDMTIPESPQLFIVENEIVSHDPFRHIGIQMLKFVTSFDEAKLSVRNYIMEAIAKDETKLERLNNGCNNSNSRNIDNYLDQAVFGEFKGLVVIDEARTELHRVLEKINANISVLELKTFEADDGKKIHLFDTLYDEYNDSLSTTTQIATNTNQKTNQLNQAARRKRRASCDTIIVPAKDEGFNQVFIGENQWYEISIGAAMKERIKFIAAYRVSPISAVTHIAEIQEIRPYKDTGNYLVTFKNKAHEIRPVKIKESKNAPQRSVYVKKEDLLKVDFLEEAMSY